jgi:hypothetical protein
MKKSIVLLILLPMLLVSCRKNEVDAPASIKELIKSFEHDGLACVKGASVDEYMFQGNLVYVFDPGTCGADMQAVVYDSNGNSIGALGGIAGNTVINGVRFDENAVLQRTIWKN